MSGRAVGEVFQDALRISAAGPEMVLPPGRSFRMGDMSGGGEEDEQPVRGKDKPPDCDGQV